MNHESRRPPGTDVDIAVVLDDVAQRLRHLDLQIEGEIGKGLGFIAVRATSSHGDLVLRIPRRHRLINNNDGIVDPLDVLRREHHLLDRLAQDGVPVARVICLSEGNGVPVLVQQYLDGAWASSADRALGAAVARLHALPVDPYSRLQPYVASVGEVATRVIRRVRHVGTHHRLPWLVSVEYLEQKLAPVAKLSLLHMDLRPENLRFDGTRVALLDWGNVLIADRSHELMRAQAYEMTSDAFRDGYIDIAHHWPLDELDPHLRAIYELDTAAMLAIVFTEEAPDEGLAKVWLGRLDVALGSLASLGAPHAR